MRRAAFFTLFLSLTMLTTRAASQDERIATLPRVLQHAAPAYPPLARQTRISGDVRLKITTDGEAVRDVEVESGHPLLKQAATDNVKTWKFEPHQPGTFEVTFRYKLLSGEDETEFLECPGIVTVETPPVKLIVDYATLGLGTWKAEFNSKNGRFSGTLKLGYSGPKGEWLSADLKMDNVQTVESANGGYYEGSFLTFEMKLKPPDGRRVKIFFLGKILKDKIVGTLVDDTGVPGEWTALRIGR